MSYALAVAGFPPVQSRATELLYKCVKFMKSYSMPTALIPLYYARRDITFIVNAYRGHAAPHTRLRVNRLRILIIINYLTICQYYVSFDICLMFTYCVLSI